MKREDIDEIIPVVQLSSLRYQLLQEILCAIIMILESGPLGLRRWRCDTTKYKVMPCDFGLLDPGQVLPLGPGLDDTAGVIPERRPCTWWICHESIRRGQTLLSDSGIGLLSHGPERLGERDIVGTYQLKSER